MNSNVWMFMYLLMSLVVNHFIEINKVSRLLLLCVLH